jgi:anti-anti-sigma regulatory factor
MGNRIAFILLESSEKSAVGIVLSLTNDATLVNFDGAMDVASAAELKTALLDACKAGKAILVSLDKITDLDVTGFQLLWAAKREAKEAGLGFELTGALPEPIGRSLLSVGLDVQAFLA